MKGKKQMEAGKEGNRDTERRGKEGREKKAGNQMEGRQKRSKEL